MPPAPPSDKTAFVWGPDDLMELPREGLVEFGVPAASLPEDDWVPRSMAGVYDADGAEPLKPFAVIQLKAGEVTVDMQLVLLGTVPGSADLLYVLDPTSGEVLQFDRRSHGVRGVNSSYRWFVEFLWQLEAAKKQRGAERLADVLNPGLRATLGTVDPFAFQAEQWWPAVWKELAPSG
ncbi:SUKH-4 family immunity protein [Glycomyces sp. NPDC047369]